MVQFEIHGGGNRLRPVGNCPMPKTQRKLSRSKSLPGWICKGCGWAFPTGDGRLVDRDHSLTDNAKTAFNKHKCRDYPRKRKPIREDVNQVAARIVEKLTKGK